MAWGWSQRPAGSLQRYFDNGTNTFSSTGSDDSFAVDTTYLMVAKLTINGSGADDSVDMWMLKEGDSFTTTEAGLGAADLSLSTADFGDGLSNIWLGRGDRDLDNATTTSAGFIDDVRISNLSGDMGLQEVLAIPEPGSLTLVGFAGIALLVLRRFRS